MLYDEEGKVQDARKHCKIAADQGIAEAQCNWGVYLYRDGKLEESKLYLQRAADQDHLRAQQNLRELFE